MANFHNALQELRNEHTQAQLQVEKLDSAILVLEELVGRNSIAPVRGGMRGGHIVSAAAQRRIAAAQEHQANPMPGKKSSTTPKRRKLSPARRTRIAAAAKARWARFTARKAR